VTPTSRAFRGYLQRSERGGSRNSSSERPSSALGENVSFLPSKLDFWGVVRDSNACSSAMVVDVRVVRAALARCIVWLSACVVVGGCSVVAPAREVETSRKVPFQRGHRADLLLALAPWVFRLKRRDQCHRDAGGEGFQVVCVAFATMGVADEACGRALTALGEKLNFPSLPPTLVLPSSRLDRVRSRGGCCFLG
jgi:hypothetical protein